MVGVLQKPSLTEFVEYPTVVSQGVEIRDIDSARVTLRDGFFKVQLFSGDVLWGDYSLKTGEGTTMASQALVQANVLLSENAPAEILFLGEQLFVEEFLPNACIGAMDDIDASSGTSGRQIEFVGSGVYRPCNSVTR